MSNHRGGFSPEVLLLSFMTPTRRIPTMRSWDITNSIFRRRCRVLLFWGPAEPRMLCECFIRTGLVSLRKRYKRAPFIRKFIDVLCRSHFLAFWFLATRKYYWIWTTSIVSGIKASFLLIWSFPVLYPPCIRIGAQLRLLSSGKNSGETIFSLFDQ